MEKALHSNYIAEKDVATLKSWRENPEAWGR